MPGAPDVIWLNGAFGVGKTTVAELMVERIEAATLLALVRLDYFDEIVGAIRRSDVDVRHFALVAPAETIVSRLGARDARDNAWARGRVADCVASLADPRFADHVDADARDATEIAADILGRLAA